MPKFEGRLELSATPESPEVGDKHCFKVSGILEMLVRKNLEDLSDKEIYDFVYPLCYDLAEQEVKGIADQTGSRLERTFKLRAESNVSAKRIERPHALHKGILSTFEGSHEVSTQQTSNTGEAWIGARENLCKVIAHEAVSAVYQSLGRNKIHISTTEDGDHFEREIRTRT